MNPEFLKVERRSGIIKIIILLIVCILSFSGSLLIIKKSNPNNVIEAENRPDHPHFVKITNTSMKARLVSNDGPNENKKSVFETSIAFFNIVGNDQKFKEGEDLRGKFWEFQLENYTGVTNVTYVSNGPLTVNNKTFIVLTDDGYKSNDKQFCQRTPNTWKYFLDHYPDHKWYFRGTHDTFVNFENLLEFIKDLESKYDPMTEYAMGYNCHEYSKVLYPHGGTGYLFSNYAVRMFEKNRVTFNDFCLQSADDVAMAYLLNHLGVPVTKFMSNKFIVTWPNTQTDVILKKNYRKVFRCPKAYRLYSDAIPMLPCPCRASVSIHMHRVPMNIAYEVLQKTPNNFAVTYLDPNSPRFCKF